MYATVSTQLVIYGQLLGGPLRPWDPSNTLAEADSGVRVQPRKHSLCYVSLHDSLPRRPCPQTFKLPILLGTLEVHSQQQKD